MRLIVINPSGHTAHEVTPEQIEGMTEQERQAEVDKLSTWIAQEWSRGRLVVLVEKPGDEGEAVLEHHAPQLTAFQYESHPRYVGG